MTARRLYVIAFFLGAAGVLLAGEVGGPGWGVAAGSVWAVVNAVVMLLPSRSGSPVEVPPAAPQRSAVTR